MTHFNDNSNGLLNKTVKCVLCGKEFKTAYIKNELFSIYNKVCEECINKKRKESEENEEITFELFWKKQCPVRFLEKQEYNEELIKNIDLVKTPCVVVFLPVTHNKTAYALEIIRRAIYKSRVYSFKFQLYSDFCFQSTLMDAGDFQTFYNELKRVYYLLIDDLCEYPINNRAELALQNLIEYRYLNNKPTVITTSINSEIIERSFQSKVIARKILDVIKKFNILISRSENINKG